MARKRAGWNRGRRVSSKGSKPKRNPHYKPAPEECIPPFDTQVDICVMCFRAKRIDVDNYYTKAIIDGCVHRGILRDDGPRWVRSIKKQHIKVKNESEEKTLVAFIPVVD